MICRAEGAVSLLGMRYAKAKITYLLEVSASRPSAAAADRLAVNSLSPSVGFEHGVLTLTMSEASVNNWCEPPGPPELSACISLHKPLFGATPLMALCLSFSLLACCSFASYFHGLPWRVRRPSMLHGVHGGLSGLSSPIDVGPDAHALFAAALPIPTNQTFHVYHGPEHNGAVGVASAGLLGQRLSLLGTAPSGVVLGGTNLSTDMWSFVDLDVTVGLPSLIKAGIKRTMPTVDHLIVDRLLSFTHKITATVESVTVHSSPHMHRHSPPLARQSAATPCNRILILNPRMCLPCCASPATPAVRVELASRR